MGVVGLAIGLLFRLARRHRKRKGELLNNRMNNQIRLRNPHTQLALYKFFPRHRYPQLGSSASTSAPAFLPALAFVRTNASNHGLTLQLTTARKGSHGSQPYRRDRADGAA
jgi:hypothetical protein